LSRPHCLLLLLFLLSEDALSCKVVFCLLKRGENRLPVGSDIGFVLCFVLIEY
jgi:hypothetical protein